MSTALNEPTTVVETSNALNIDRISILPACSYSKIPIIRDRVKGISPAITTCDSPHRVGAALGTRGRPTLRIAHKESNELRLHGLSACLTLQGYGDNYIRFVMRRRSAC